MNKRDDHHAGVGSRLRLIPHTERWRRRTRIALYSHDTMGLGHMRRNLLIAQALMRTPSPPIILMIAGAREAGALPIPPGVDCLTLPAFGKDTEGRTCSRHLEIHHSELAALRSRTIAAAIDTFKPDVLIVDKVPRGAGHELDATLRNLSEHGLTRCVLGLRDVLDDAETVRREWREAKTEETINESYDAVWVYGDAALYNPVREYGFSREVAAKVRFTGYLDQRLRLLASAQDDGNPGLDLPDGRIALCLVGGGQDGSELAEAFAQTTLPADMTGVLLTGPYLPAESRQRVLRAAERSNQLRVVEFLTEPSSLLRRADRVISMGGYNTVNEILSFRKTALVVPRIKPRLEQRIRAERLRDLGLLDMLPPDRLSPQALGDWLQRDLPTPPSVHDRFNWKGLDNLPGLVDELLAAPPWKVRHYFPEPENPHATENLYATC
ncbi:MAG: glycosyltransferase family protein [Isosphaeraceae bacterium]